MRSRPGSCDGSASAASSDSCVSSTRDVKTAAPDSLFTYVNFPPTEHLDLECFDVCAFNVYLHREPDLRGYLARLQHIAGAKPLLLAEAGADSVREGLEGQARITTMQLRAAFLEGACGAIVYSWTDEWWRGGRSVDDWAFGLVDDARQPKPALAAVSEAFAEAPCLISRAHSVAKGFGGGMRLQRRRHDRRLPELACQADLPELRGDRRQRRIAGRHGFDRAPTCRACGSSTRPTAA